MYKLFNQFKYLLLALAILPDLLFAQHKSEGDSLLTDASLENVVQYALTHYPLIQQSQIDEATARETIKTKLADWYPQISFVYNYQRNIQLQTLVIAGNAIKAGYFNQSSPQLFATQNIFNRDVLLASRTAGAVKESTRQTTESRKIDLTVNVTKAFYDVLATTQQIKVGQGDVNRLKQSLKTATDQYSAGLTDKTDFKRATIALNNTLATLNSNEQLLKYKIEYLKSLMGYPVESDLKIVYDTMQMENEIAVDTVERVNYKERIEFKLYQTQRYLQESNVKYQKLSYAPTVTAFGYYINYFYNNSFGELYNKSYPNSYVGASLNWPLFQGGKRRANVKLQKLTLERLDWDITNLEKTVNAQYNQALSAYKANLATYLTLKENMELAKEVYDVIQLQYKSGVKTYLEVITAETDLRNARINYFNSLYGVLASKVDLQKALGEINY
jgi:outer membrane protein